MSGSGHSCSIFFIIFCCEGSFPHLLWHCIFLLSAWTVVFVWCLHMPSVMFVSMCHVPLHLMSWPRPPCYLIVSYLPHLLPYLFSLCSLFLPCFTLSSPAAGHVFPYRVVLVCFWGRAHCSSNEESKDRQKRKPQRGVLRELEKSLLLYLLERITKENTEQRERKKQQCWKGIIAFLLQLGSWYLKQKFISRSQILYWPV